MQLARHARRKVAFPALLLCGLLAATRMHAAAEAPGQLTLATWNLEWLVSARTSLEARLACAAGRRPAVPCDVAVGAARDSADIAALNGIARQLDADVVAFQEVEDEATAARVFGSRRLCIAGGSGMQHTGFAIRPGLLFRCGPHLESLALGGRSRAGAGLVLYPDSHREIRLLSVHLKSGCPAGSLAQGTPACRTLRSQAGPLAEWIREQAAGGHRYAVVGDFNRDLRTDARTGTGVWPLIAAGGEPDVASLDRPFRNCHPGQPFAAYIDHILAGRLLAASEISGSFRRSAFDPLAVRRRRLSDHCPVSVAFRLPP